MSLPVPSGQTADEGSRRAGLGLSGKLLVLTVIFVMLAEVLIFVPSIANFRRAWLNDRIAAAQVAALVLEGAPREGLPEGVEQQLLAGVGAQAIAVRVGGARRLLSREDTPSEVSRTVDLRDANAWTAIRDALLVLLLPVSEPIRVVQAGMGQVEFVEIIIDEGPLRDAMLAFSRNILILSLVISAITAGLVFLSLNWLIVKPVRKLAMSITAFEAEPDNPGRILTPSGRRDEIGEAEAALARMETTLAGEFRRKAHLAALGLAVSKINHDLRNMLASAQLWSDRLTDSPDPQVRRFAPRLIATLDRAISFCQATLSYGQAVEQPPQRRPIPLRAHADEVAALLGLDDEARLVRFDNRIGDAMLLHADPDHLSRILTNLIRNSVEALTRAGSADGEPVVTIEARRLTGRLDLIVRDNGPGLPEQAKAHLFQAFKGSTSAGGSGLGLAIAAELVTLHGGSIMLDGQASGACFVIAFPDQASVR